MYNKEELLLFASRAENGTCSHAYIIDGEAGVGKLNFAMDAAGILLCQGAKKPCGLCDACIRIKSGGHSDIFVIGREKTASMDDVRELIRRSNLKPNEADKQVFVVCNAGKLRRDAQNALLKIIEEPPKGCVIFLLTESRSSLLPTVLSRGHKIHLSGWTDSELEEYLISTQKNADPQMIKKAVAAAGGNANTALEFLSKEHSAAKKEAEKLFLLALGSDRYALAKQLVATKHKRDSIVPLLLRLVTLINAELQSKYRPSAEYTPVSGTVTKRTLFRMEESVIACIAALESNANVTAALSKLAADLFAAKAG